MLTFLGLFIFMSCVSSASPRTQPSLSFLMSQADVGVGGVAAPYDPFADANGDDEVVTKGIVHIRLQQRNGRKSLTTIQGLDEKLDLNKLTKAFKKEFCCNGCVVDNKELGRIVQLQGDQREKVKDFLADEEIASKKMIKFHGI
jgi:translation initiation factor 1